MKRSTRDRILTTRVDSLPRADGTDRPGGEDDAALRKSVAGVVARQREIGIDIVNEGEYSQSPPLVASRSASRPARRRSRCSAPGSMLWARPFVKDIAMDAVPLTMAVLDGPDLARRLIVARRLARRPPAA